MPISIRSISHSLCKNLAKDISSCDSGRRNNLFPLSIFLWDSSASLALLVKGRITSWTFSSLILKALAAAKNLLVLPGAIDTQVHFREPGLTHKEDIKSGTKGAILGGITSIFEMPNTNPSTTTSEAIKQKLNIISN